MTTRLNRYVPGLVYTFIEQSKPPYKDHLYLICDTLYRLSKKDNEYTSFVDISLNTFTNIITDKKIFYQCLDFLITNKIIEKDNQYKVGVKSKGYRFSKEFISPNITIPITNTTLIKRVIHGVNKHHNALPDKYKPYRNHFLNTFKIDYDNTIKLLNNWCYYMLCEATNDDEQKKIINRYNQQYTVLSSINDGALYFKRCKTNGRIDTNLTSLKKEFKKFIVGDDLVSIDIKNSQPYLLSLLLKERGIKSINTLELNKYNDWVSTGQFYENFKHEYSLKTAIRLSRDAIKQMMFGIYYSRNEHYTKDKDVFRQVFPDILRWIEKQKRTNYKQLAIKMQQMESGICIDVVCSELNKAGIKYYTVHDSWIVNMNDLETTKEIIYRCFDQKYNSRPALETEVLKDIQIDFKKMSERKGRMRRKTKMTDF